jgi:hypothetical protein
MQAIAGLLQLMHTNAAAGVAFSGLLATQLEDGGREMPLQNVLEVAVLLRTHLLSCTISRQRPRKTTQANGISNATDESAIASTINAKTGHETKGRRRANASEDASKEAAALEGSRPRQQKGKGSGKRPAAESVDALVTESPEDWAAIMAAVAELCGRLCAMARAASQQREERGASAAVRKGQKCKRKGRATKLMATEEGDEEEFFTVEDIVPENCLVELLEKAPNTQV